MQPQGLMRNPAGLQHPRPEQPHGAKLGQRQEHVLVGGKRDTHNAFRRQVIKFPQRANNLRQNAGQLLRFARPLLVTHTAISLKKRPLEPLRRQFSASLAK